MAEQRVTSAVSANRLSTKVLAEICPPSLRGVILGKLPSTLALRALLLHMDHLDCLVSMSPLSIRYCLAAMRFFGEGLLFI